jgi:cytochrome P450
MIGDPVVLTSPDAIAAALDDDRLAPPVVDAMGSTWALRRAMARFSGPAEHQSRRSAVTDAIDSLDVASLSSMATERTTRRLSAELRGRVELVTSIGRPVAVEAVASGFGVLEAELFEVVQAVDKIAAVIGRGAAADTTSDDAADHLCERFARHPAGPIAVISALYQSMDATAFLVASRLLERPPARAAVVPIVRTIRVATEPLEIDGRSIPKGAAIHLELGTAHMWFGAGPHTCPGRVLAESISAAIVHAIELSGAVVDADGTELDLDHRPVAVWLILDR